MSAAAEAARLAAAAEREILWSNMLDPALVDAIHRLAGRTIALACRRAGNQPVGSVVDAVILATMRHAGTKVSDAVIRYNARRVVREIQRKTHERVARARLPARSPNLFFRICRGDQDEECIRLRIHRSHELAVRQVTGAKALASNPSPEAVSAFVRSGACRAPWCAVTLRSILPLLRDPADILASAHAIGAGLAATPWVADRTTTAWSLRRIVRIAPTATDGIAAGLATRAPNDTTMRLLAVLSPAGPRSRRQCRRP